MRVSIFSSYVISINSSPVLSPKLNFWMMPCLVPAIFFLIELAQSLNLSSNLSFLSVFLSSCVILGHIFLKGIDGRLDKVYLKTSILEDGIIILLFNALLTLSTKILGYEIE